MFLIPLLIHPTSLNSLPPERGQIFEDDRIIANFIGYFMSLEDFEDFGILTQTSSQNTERLVRMSQVAFHLGSVKVRRSDESCDKN